MLLAWVIARSVAMTCGEFDDAVVSAKAGPKRASVGRVVVHLHYYESSEYERCKLIVKRTNLALFVKAAVLGSSGGTTFVVTASGDGVPPADDFFASVGVPAWGPTVLPDSVVYRRVNNTLTDLCPRALVLRDYVTSDVTHALFLNDGVRGPFAEGPSWLDQFLRAFAEPDVGVVGVVAGCEGSFHLQSWAVMIDAKKAGRAYLDLYNWTCHAHVKHHIVDKAEIGAVTTTSPTIGAHAIAALWPPLHGDAALLRSCLDTNAAPRLKRYLHMCKNLYVPARYPGRFAAPTRLTDVVFTKFGGNVWESIPADFKARVTSQTQRRLGPALAEATCYNLTR